jgi:GTPase involved in cell partitioning and DNA repair
VRRKRGRVLLGDLVRPGQQLRVADGGRGGLGARHTPGGSDAAPRLGRGAKTSNNPDAEPLLESSVLAVSLDATAGEAGEEVTLELLLRVVADVGIVGLPNAGKSSLLAAVTRAAPEVAPYPFTTLMPNLGVLSHSPLDASAPAVLADLPGLIEGAHRGVGLGRAFLRHLRRTRGMVHVVDASAEAPLTDYLVVRHELRLYNPEYLRRPHLVALNKTDAPGVAARLPGLLADFAAAAELQGAPGSGAEGDDNVSLGAPRAVFAVSALNGDGLSALLGGLDALIRDANDAERDGYDAELRLSDEERAMVAGARASR